MRSLTSGDTEKIGESELIKVNVYRTFKFYKGIFYVLAIDERIQQCKSRVSISCSMTGRIMRSILDYATKLNWSQEAGKINRQSELSEKGNCTGWSRAGPLASM